MLALRFRRFYIGTLENKGFQTDTTPPTVEDGFDTYDRL